MDDVGRFYKFCVLVNFRILSNLFAKSLCKYSVIFVNITDVFGEHLNVVLEENEEDKMVRETNKLTSS